VKQVSYWSLNVKISRLYAGIFYFNVNRHGAADIKWLITNAGVKFYGMYYYALYLPLRYNTTLTEYIQIRHSVLRS